MLEIRLFLAAACPHPSVLRLSPRMLPLLLLMMWGAVQHFLRCTCRWCTRHYSTSLPPTQQSCSSCCSAQQHQQQQQQQQKQQGTSRERAREPCSLPSSLVLRSLTVQIASCLLHTLPVSFRLSFASSLPSNIFGYRFLRCIVSLCLRLLPAILSCLSALSAAPVILSLSCLRLLLAGLAVLSFCLSLCFCLCMFFCFSQSCSLYQCAMLCLAPSPHALLCLLFSLSIVSSPKVNLLIA